MTDAQLIAEAIDRNTAALAHMNKRLDYLSELYEVSLQDNVNWPSAVSDIIAAIKTIKPA